MTSLIDVIFLLLLFFMLSSTFSKYSEIELDAALPGGTATGAAGPSVRVALSSGHILVNGRTVAQRRLAPRVDAVLGGQGGLVVLAVDEAESAQRLTDVLLTLRELDDIRIRVEREP